MPAPLAVTLSKASDLQIFAESDYGAELPRRNYMIEAAGELAQAAEDAKRFCKHLKETGKSYKDQVRSYERQYERTLGELQRVCRAFLSRASLAMADTSLCRVVGGQADFRGCVSQVDLRHRLRNRLEDLRRRR